MHNLTRPFSLVTGAGLLRIHVSKVIFSIGKMLEKTKSQGGVPIFVRFLLVFKSSDFQPLLFDNLSGDAFDHLVEPLLVKILRSFTGLPVLGENVVEFDLPLRFRNQRLGVDERD